MDKVSVPKENTTEGKKRQQEEKRISSGKSCGLGGMPVSADDFKKQKQAAFAKTDRPKVCAHAKKEDKVVKATNSSRGHMKSAVDNDSDSYNNNLDSSAGSKSTTGKYVCMLIFVFEII